VSRERELAGQKVVVIGGSSGIGLETARQARSEGADVILAARNPERLEHAARDLGALSSAAFDATDFDRLGRFFDELPTPIDHVLVTSGGPYYARLADIDFAQARRNVEAVFWLPLHIARRAVGKVRPGGSLLFINGTGGRRAGAGAVLATFTAAIPALTSLLNSRELKICLLQSSTIEFSVIRGFSQAFRPCRDSRSALGAGEKPYLGKALPKLTDTETSSETAGTG
jgi:NAD(P)-dependent dehydrogenase (short-subunit alcohol dehydrogenase family)